MGNCCGCRSNADERLTSPVSKEKKQSSFSEEVEEQQKPLEGEPEPTPKKVPLGTNNAVLIDIVYYEDPIPAGVSRATSCAKVDEELFTDPTGPLDCVKATGQIQQCIGLNVQVSITKVMGFKARCDQDSNPKSLIEVTVTPEPQSKWPTDGSTLSGQLKGKIEDEWKSQLKKDYFALITVKQLP